MTKALLPQNYEAWHRCITVDCGLELTPSFIQQRIELLQNKRDHHTKKFIDLYSERYCEIVIEWFRHAQSKPSSTL